MKPYTTDSKGFLQMKSTGCLKSALKYHRLGFSVLPVHSVRGGLCTCGNRNCDKPGKHSIINWKPYQKQKASEVEINQWWKRWPWANVAIVTGSISGVVVLDLDGAEGVESVSGKELPHTVTAETGGGGWHYFFKHPGDKVIGNRTDLLPKVDVRGDGGYVVVDPSVHISGKQYTWFCEPGETELAEIPAWLVEELEKKKESEPAPPVAEKIIKGARNSTLASLAGSMRRRGMNTEAIYAALSVENQNKCHPPLDDDEVQRIAESVGKYPPAEPTKKQTCENPRKDNKKEIDISKLLTKPDLNKEIKPIEWVVPGVVPKGGLTLTVGPQKGGKSMLWIRGACEISSGGNFMDGFARVDRQKVLYVMYDNVGEGLINYRMRKAGWALNTDFLRFVYAENVRQQGVTLDLDQLEGYTLFEMIIRSWDPAIVFIDTLGSAHSSDESKNKDMKPLIHKLTSLARDLNIGIVALHHTRKRKVAEYGVAMQQDDSIGASIILRLASNIIGVEKRVDESGRTVHIVKNMGSWFKEFQPFEFSLVDEIDEDGREWLRMPVNLSPGVDDDSKEKVIKVLKFSYSYGESFTRRDIAKRTGLSEKTTGGVLNSLVNTGFLKSEGATQNKVFFVPGEQDDEIPF